MGIRVRWLIVAATVAVVGLTSAGAYALTSGAAPVEMKAGTASVDRGEVAVAVATTGALEPAESRDLSFATSGAVTEVGVRVGDQVTTGQVLAKIDATDAQERVDDAEEALAEAQDALDEAESSSGTTVCPVAVRVTASPSPSVSPSATPSPSASPSPTRSAQSPAPSSTGAGDCASSQRSGGGDAILTTQQRVISAEQTLAEAEDQLAGTKISAPIAGKVLAVAGSVGSEVNGGNTFVTLADVAGMQVAASFPEADAGRLAVGLSGTVTLANHHGEEFAARVVRVDPVGTADDSGLVKYGVVLAFEKVPADLLVGQTANVRVATSAVADALRVPVSALRDDGTVLVRTTVGDEARAVEVGLRGDQYAEIKTGLIEGDEVVIVAS